MSTLHPVNAVGFLLWVFQQHLLALCFAFTLTVAGRSKLFEGVYGVFCAPC